MKILVTGGGGFIGSHIAEQLQKAGHSIIVVDNLLTGFKANVPHGAVFVKCDIRSADFALIAKKEKPDVIVHAAAQISVRESMEDPALDTSINVLGLVNILHSFKGQKLPHIVFLSTGGAIYGEQSAFPAPESHAMVPTSVYGLGKRVGELYFELWAAQFGLRYTGLRLSNVYGPRQSPHGEAGVVAIFCNRLLQGKVPVINGSGEQTRDFVYVGDVALAAQKVIDKNITGIFNIGTGVETSVNGLYNVLTRAMGVAVRPSYGPEKVGEQFRSCIDPSLALRSFGWRAEVDLQAGLKLTADWFRAQSQGQH